LNAHHQNGKAEKIIRDLQVNGRTMLVHAIDQWKDAVVPNLWPSGTRLTNEVLNITPRTNDGRVSITLFAKRDCPPRLEHLNPFGSPAYVLDNNLQQSKKLENGKTEVIWECTWGHPHLTHDLFTLYTLKQGWFDHNFM